MMKKYIMPKCEIVDVLMESQLMQMSSPTLKEEVADEGIWLAPEVDMERQGFWE